MIKLMFAIFDSKAKYFNKPFMFQSKGEAVRGFSDLANDTQTEIGRHPEDFTLFYLGEYMQDKGSFKNAISPESLGVAIEYIKTEPEKLRITDIKEVEGGNK